MDGMRVGGMKVVGLTLYLTPLWACEVALFLRPHGFGTGKPCFWFNLAVRVVCGCGLATFAN